MIDPLAAFSLPRQRLSMQAMVTVGALHIALLWVMLQSGPAVQVTRQAVMQYFSPITQLREKPATKPVQAVAPAPKPKPVPVEAPTAPPPPPRAVTPPQPVEQAPVPVLQKMEAVTPQRANVKIQDIKTDTRRTPDVLSPRVEQVLTPLPVLPTPEPLPAPKPVPEPAPPPVQTPPPPPTPAPQPMPEPVAPPPPAPVPTPAPAPAAPAPAPALPPAPIAAPARAAAITPIETRAAPAGAAGGTGSASPAAAQTAPGVAPGGSGLNLNYNYRANAGGRQKTAAEMANEQLNGTGRRDKLAESVNAAEKPDCVNSGQALGLLAPVAIAYNVVKDKCK